ncbi:MAG: xanthine dehydrogenase family protein molybdopterin-binding subunit [Acidimicrobiales bacterium]
MSMIGTRVVRKEDPELLTVGGKYVDDIAPADALFVTFVRSILPHATLTGIDTSAAAALDGVVGVFTAADLGFTGRPHAMPMLNQGMLRTWLASDRVRYVGEPVAVVVSTSREAGVDAAELVDISYDELPVLVDPLESVADELLLFPEAGTNVVFAMPDASEGDPFADCDTVVELSFRNHRMAPCPIEPRGTLAIWNGQRLTIYSSTQGSHGTRDGLAAALGIDKDELRVIAPAVGGGFGAKSGAYPEDVVIATIARQLGQPLRWVETRTESMLGLVHGRGQLFEAKMGGTSDGRITAYSLRVVQDGGAYAEMGSILPFMTRTMTSGCYDIANVAFDSRSVVTNTVPTGAFRGAGRPEAAAAVERMIDLFASEVGIDPVEIRKSNVHAPDAFPLTTPTGARMDCGDYAGSLDRALEAAGYDELRAEQAKRRENGDHKLLGIGLSTYVEITNPTNAGEYGSVEIRPDGTALLLTGQSPHGQGHYTTFAQLTSELTGIPVDKIEVRHGDTDEVPRGAGTGGSKAMQLGGTAIWQATESVVERAKEIAAELFEANPSDIVLDTENASFSVAGTPAITRSWAEVAEREAQISGSALRSEIDFKPAGATFPFGSHVSVVEVDTDTGLVTVLRHIACDDAGTIVNPMIVDGQVHGGVASGIAQALMEEFSYDANGNPLTSTFMNYSIISATELPSFERVPMETPTPMNPLGAKGIGESGTIGATPAVQNAVVDALSHVGIRHVDIPVTPERVWRAIQDAATAS